MNRREHLVLAASVLLLAALACGGGSGPGEGQLVEGTLAHGLSEKYAAVDPGSDFTSGQTVYLALRVAGQPKSGTYTARFYFGDQLISEASVDLASAGSGNVLAIGADTAIGYTLTHENPLPLSGHYRVDVQSNGQPAGTYAFKVLPPADAVASKLLQAALAHGVDAQENPVEPASEFAPDQPVYLVGLGTFGKETWLQAEWSIAGKVDPAATRSLTFTENKSGSGFDFSYLPDGGWPEGDHSVVLMMNGDEAGRYTFKVAAPSASLVPTPEATSAPAVLFQDGFSSPASGWDVFSADVGSAGYADGAYQLLIKQAQQVIWGSAGKDFADVRINVVARKAGGPDHNIFGVLCRDDHNKNFYFFEVGSDGAYGIFKLKAGAMSELDAKAMRVSPLIGKAGPALQLRAECAGSRLSLYLGDTLLAEAHDSEFTHGDVGLIAGSFEVPSPVDIRFDDFAVTQP